MKYNPRLDVNTAEGLRAYLRQVRYQRRKLERQALKRANERSAKR